MRAQGGQRKGYKRRNGEEMIGIRGGHDERLKRRELRRQNGQICEMRGGEKRGEGRNGEEREKETSRERGEREERLEGKMRIEGRGK